MIKISPNQYLYKRNLYNILTLPNNNIPPVIANFKNK